MNDWHILQFEALFAYKPFWHTFFVTLNQSMFDYILQVTRTKYKFKYVPGSPSYIFVVSIFSNRCEN